MQLGAGLHQLFAVPFSLLQVFEDLYTYMKSLELILAQKSSIVYPAHGPVVQDPDTHIGMYISHRNMRESQILEALRSKSDQPLTAMNLVKIIYTVRYFTIGILQ